MVKFDLIKYNLQIMVAIPSSLQLSTATARPALSCSSTVSKLLRNNFCTIYLLVYILFILRVNDQFLMVHQHKLGHLMPCVFEDFNSWPIILDPQVKDHVQINMEFAKCLSTK